MKRKEEDRKESFLLTIHSSLTNMPNTKDFVPVSQIKNDLVVLSDGSMAVVIQTSAVNFDLLSENEQLAIIGSFAALLNSLSFSIQIVIRSKKLDISHYLDTLKIAEKKQTSPLLQMMMQRYRAFVEAIIRDNEVLDKQFYVVLAVSPIELGVVSSMDAEKNFPKALNILGPRRDHIIKQLSRIGLKSIQLDDERLIKLFYDIYNDADKISLTEVQANPANATAANQLTGKREEGRGNMQDQTQTVVPSEIVAQAKATAPMQSAISTQQSAAPRPPLYSSSNNSRQAPFVVEELPA